MTHYCPPSVCSLLRLAVDQRRLHSRNQTNHRDPPEHHTAVAREIAAAGLVAGEAVSTFSPAHLNSNNSLVDIAGIEHTLPVAGLSAVVSVAASRS